MDASETITVTTPTCHVCGKTGSVTVPLAGLEAWEAGDLIQVAFPDLHRALREQIKTGSHPECFQRMIGLH